MTSTSGSVFKKCDCCGYVGSFVSIFRGEGATFAVIGPGGSIGIAICPRDRGAWTGLTTRRSTSSV